MHFKKLVFTLLLSITMVPATFADDAQCEGIITVGDTTCRLDEAGPNGDGRVYCHYTCKNGSEVVIVFTP